MKKFLCVLAGLALVGSVYAATDYVSRDQMDRIFDGNKEVNALKVKDLTVSDDATFVDVTVSGTLSGSVVSSNAVGSLVTSNLTVVAGGTITVPAASVSAAALSGNIAQARITNALVSASIPSSNLTANIDQARITNALATASAIKLTNTCLAADGKTNTYVFSPVGGVYVLSGISTTP